VRRLHYPIRGIPSVLFVVFLLAVPGLVQAASRPTPADWTRVSLGDPVVAETVRWALQGASRRLGTASCQTLLVDFQDKAGRPLQARLEELDHTASDYLRLVLFRDGTKTARCRDTQIVAFTTPGSRVVFVCEETFEGHWRRDRRFAEAVLIHEALHTLGLGENPPTSREITRQVLERCGR
jgi:hypothetical protein